MAQSKSKGKEATPAPTPAASSSAKNSGKQTNTAATGKAAGGTATATPAQNKTVETVKKDVKDVKDVKQVSASGNASHEKGKTKLTEKANLNLNVNSFKSWLRKYYEQTGTPAPKFRGIHVALTVVSEVLCKQILEATISQLQKEPSGLYNITRPAIRYAVLLDTDLEFLLGHALSSFDKTMTFTDHFCISEKEMRKYIESELGKNIQLDAVAYNLLAYLLAKVVIDFARLSHMSMTYAKKNSLDFNVIKHVVRMKCTGSLENILIRNIEDTEKLFVPDEEEDEQVQAPDNEDAAPVTNKKGGKNKVQEQIQEEEEEQADDQDDQNEQDLEGEADVEPEPEPVPEQKKKIVKGTVKKSSN